MKSWTDAVESHYRDTLGEPSARFAIEPGRSHDSMLQLLYFSRGNGTTLLCTVGVHDLAYRMGVDRCEVIGKVKGSPPDDFSFVFLNALWLSFERLGLTLLDGLCVPIIAAVSPAFAAKVDKAALFFRTAPKDAPVPPVKNGPMTLEFLVCSLITREEADVAELDGVAELRRQFVARKTELADLSRPSAVPDCGRGLPDGWRAIVVPAGNEHIAFKHGARWDEDAERWGVPPAVAVHVFEPWYTLQTRVDVCLAGVKPRLVMPPKELEQLLEAELPVSVPFARSTVADIDRRFAYQLINYDKTTTSIESNLLIRSGHFEYAGHFYRRASVFDASATIPCEEVSPIKGGSLRRRSAAQWKAFLQARSPVGGDLKGTDEASITAAVLAMLQPHFHVERECWGEHPSGRRLCVDAMLRPKDYSDWANQEVALAIEFKSPKRVRSKGQKDAAIMAQCLDYSLCRFDNYPTFLVFACPLPAYLTDERYFLRFLARYHVGRVDFSWGNGLRFLLGDQIVWDEERGLCDLGRRSKFPKLYGNRDGDGGTQRLNEVDGRDRG